MIFFCFLVLASALTVLYLKRKSKEPPLKISSDEDGEYARLDRKIRDLRTRRSVPGDKCIVCLMDMKQGDMHFLNCYHALDNACFGMYRDISRYCPICWEPL
uniref:Uncharacterized protein LOC108038632 n=1 Tax=Drosophila rhopaloa TaxID=1041015 RepID=A0A6P4E3D1_DRORH